MNELAVKSANGTNSTSDRSYIQDEINQLTTEIDRVAQTTKFNETYLLKGNNAISKGYSFTYGKATASTAEVAFATDTATSASLSVSFEGPGATVTNSAVNELLKSFRDQGVTLTTSGGQYSLQLNGDAASNYDVVSTSNDGTAYEIKDLKGNKIATVAAQGPNVQDSVTILATAGSCKAQQSDSELQVFYDADGNAVAANALSNYFAMNSDGSTIQVKAEAPTLYDAVGTAYTKADLATKAAAAEIAGHQDLTAALSMKFQVGADTSSANKISVNISAMTAKGLGINGLKVSSSVTADAAVNTISEAIQKVSKQRSALGAVQNRLEHTINNLDNVVENTTSAESAIRDTDMATEMVTYSNANILSQAGQAMLAQSNQSNQGVLSLLG
jgi:flagellin